MMNFTIVSNRFILNYLRLSRNFYEASRVKGPQDAAGGFLKKQADLAVLRGKFEIQSAKDFFHFATANLTEHKSGIYKVLFANCLKISEVYFFSLRQDILIFDDVHSSACNIGNFLGQAFSGIFFLFF
jgi:hypothetical protein